MWGSFFSGGKDPLKDLGYEILADNQQVSTTNARSIWTILNGKKKANGDLVTIFSCQNESYVREETRRILINFYFSFRFI